MNPLKFIASIAFLISPFSLGWVLFYLFHPSDFWGSFAAAVFIFVACVIEAFFAWIIGLGLFFGG